MVRKPGETPTMLTRNDVRLTSDDRIMSLMNKTKKERVSTLRIMHVRAEDAGIYTCEVPTHPMVSANVNITVAGKCSHPYTNKYFSNVCFHYRNKTEILIKSYIGRVTLLSVVFKAAIYYKSKPQIYWSKTNV